MYINLKASYKVKGGRMEGIRNGDFKYYGIEFALK